METSGSRLRAWFGSIFAPFAFAPRQQALGFASLAVVAAFAVIFLALHLKGSGPEYAREVKPYAPVAFTIPEFKVKETAVTEAGTGRKEERIVAVKHPVKRARPRPQANREEPLPQVANNAVPKQPAATTPKDPLLPGERSYLTAIASLTTNLEVGGEMSLKPSLRVEYERNLAVVDQAIEVTRRAARSNPNDDDAANFLLTAYQSKVDLLNTVADQARLSASAR